MLAEAEAPSFMVREAGELLRVKLVGLICSVKGVVAVRPAEVPVIVKVYCPGTAELLAVSVSVLLEVVGFGEKDAVTRWAARRSRS